MPVTPIYSIYLQVLRQRTLLLLAMALFGALGGSALGAFSHKEYSATEVSFLRVKTGVKTADLRDTGPFLTTAAQALAHLAETDPIHAQAAVIAGIDSGVLSGNRITVKIPTGTTFLEITATAADPNVAAKLADGAAAALRQNVTVISPESSDQGAIPELVAISAAVPPAEPSGVPLWMTTLVGTAVAVLVTFFAAVAMEVVASVGRSGPFSNEHTPAPDADAADPQHMTSEGAQG